jgi:hypothetical protein
MTIEWGGINLQSNMTCQVLDNTPAPASVLDANEPFTVRMGWTVPAALAPFLGGSFRLRVYVESFGPGPERQVGQVNVPIVPGQQNYAGIDMIVPGNTLPGEGAPDPVTGQPVSGLYRCVAVLQHLNGGATEGSGYHDGTLIQLRQP